MFTFKQLAMVSDQKAGHIMLPFLIAGMFLHQTSGHGLSPNIWSWSFTKHLVLSPFLKADIFPLHTAGHGPAPHVFIKPINAQY